MIAQYGQARACYQQALELAGEADPVKASAALHGLATIDLNEGAYPAAREKFEKSYLVQVLTMVKGNVSRAAELARKDRAEFYRLLRKHALDPGVFKSEKAVE